MYNNVSQVSAVLYSTPVLLMKLTCLHIALLWQRCESVSELFRGSADCLETGFLLFCSFSVSSGGKSQACPVLMQVSPPIRWGLLQVNTVLKSNIVLLFIAVASQRWATLKHPCAVSSSSYLHSCLTCSVSLAWLVTLKLWFRKTGQRQLFLCSPLYFSLPPSLSLSHTPKYTHTLRFFISLSLTLQLGILEFGCWFSMENFNGESSGALNVW